MSKSNIMLGDGVFFINDVAIGLTRGGGNFEREVDYRPIEADGDLGPVKGRLRKIGATARLTLNVSELDPALMTDLYPGLDYTDSVLTAKEAIEAVDYNDSVSFVGQTLDGDEIEIKIFNALNLDNLSWDLVDKEEVVPEVVFTATYNPATRKTEPWQVTFGTTGS